MSGPGNEGTRARRPQYPTEPRLDGRPTFPPDPLTPPVVSTVRFPSSLVARWGIAVAEETRRRVGVGLVEVDARPVTSADVTRALVDVWLDDPSILDSRERTQYSADYALRTVSLRADQRAAMRVACAREPLRRAKAGVETEDKVSVSSVLRDLMDLWLDERDVLDDYLAADPYLKR